MTTDLRSTWGERLRRARLDAGFSQAALAVLVGCGQKDISGYECGRSRPSDAYKVRLAVVLGRAPRELFPLLPADLAPVELEPAEQAAS